MCASLFRELFAELFANYLLYNEKADTHTFVSVCLHFTGVNSNGYLDLYSIRLKQGSRGVGSFVADISCSDDLKFAEFNISALIVNGTIDDNATVSNADQC